MRFTFLVIFTLVMFSACEFFFGGSSKKDDDIIGTEPEPEPVQKTVIVFDNSNGTCAVEVYNSYLRTQDSKIVTVPAGELSKEFEWTPGSSVPFFFSYNLNLIGINALTIDFIPEIVKDQTYIRVDANKKNSIPIPTLAETASSPDALLSDNSYIIIQNNSSYSISLQRGSVVLVSDNFSDTGVNPGERAHYILKNTDSRTVSGYLVNENGRTSSFPSSLINFDAGRVYCFVYNGSSISLFTVLDIKLGNVASGSLDDPGNKTYVRFTNSNDFSVSVYTNFARNNKIADAPALSQSNSVITDPNLSGAVFYPNYNIVIEGVTIPYQGDIIVTRIDAGKTTAVPNTVAIPPIDDLDTSEFEKPLVDSAYVKIQNDSIYSLSFLYNQSELLPQGSMSGIVNGGETALYNINPGNILNYSLRRNMTNAVSFPENFTQFEAGKLYSFRYHGSNLVLLTEKPLTLKQAYALSPPENITARTRPSGSVILSWNKVGLETSYKIYRSVESTDNFEYIGSVINTSYTDNDVVLGNTYYYKLVSVKNTMESSISENYVSVLSEITSLSAPTGLTASVQGNDSILLSWDSVEDASTYMIYRGNSSSNVNTYVAAISSTSYLVSALEENTGYWFTVSSANNHSESYPSEAVYGQTFLNVPPEPPTGLNASTLNNSIQVSWNNVTGVTGYKVYRSTGENGTYSLAGNVSSSPFSDSGLTPNITYYYKVSSVRGTQESGLSGSVSVKLVQTITPPGSTLAEQLAYVRNHTGNGTVFEIVVNRDEFLGPTSVDTMGLNITVNIRSVNSSNIKTIQLEGQGHLFSIDTGVTMILQDIVLRGHSTNTRALIGVGQSTLILNSGTKIIMNTSSDSYGGGIRINGGMLEMNEGVEISGNIVTGLISYGGGICAENKSNVVIRGGIITENWARGAEYMSSYPYSAGVGGGISITSNSTVNMTGGIISKNKCSSYTGGYGGGVFIANDANFTKRAALGSYTSGIIYGSSGDNANILAAGDRNNGYALRRNFGSLQNRNTTLGPGDEISTGNDVGWE